MTHAPMSAIAQRHVFLCESCQRREACFWVWFEIQACFGVCQGCAALVPNQQEMVSCQTPLDD